MKYLVCVSLLLLMVSCSPVETPDEKTDEKTETHRLTLWLDDQFAEYLASRPLAKTRLGDKSDYGELDDVSEQAALASITWRQNSVKQMLADFDRDQLSSDGQLSWDLWVYLSERAEAGKVFIRHRYFLGRSGPHTSLPNNLINYHKVDDIGDMQAYISRLNQSRRYLGQYLERAKASANENIRAPYFTYDVSMSQIKRVITGTPFNVAVSIDAEKEPPSAIWADALGKIAALQDTGAINEDQARDLTAQVRSALLENFAPIYEEMFAWLKADRKNVPAAAVGASGLPNGDAYYKYRLELMTTLPLTPDQIHQSGLDEVSRIQTEMLAVKDKAGFEGSLDEFFVFMRNDDQFYYPNTDEGRLAYIALANTYLDAMRKKLPEFFGILPKAGLEVRRVEAFREQPGAAAHYMRGTKDGSRPGVFYAHLSDMRATAIYRLEDLAYHEGLPGHHMQISIQQELEGIPRFRTYHGYTAFSEGWGLYAEYLGKEMGFYDDAYTDFGRLSGEIWRAIRLVVDTGIHAKHWTEAEAVEYALANSPKPESAVKSEIRRYFNMPAQATAYKVGMLKIQEYRAHAEKHLGDRFDIREFHDLVLGAGSLPLPLLEARVNQWISSKLYKFRAA